jgi:hypothetical protein
MSRRGHAEVIPVRPFDKLRANGLKIKSTLAYFAFDKHKAAVIYLDALVGMASGSCARSEPFFTKGGN